MTADTNGAVVPAHWVLATQLGELTVVHEGGRADGALLSAALAQPDRQTSGSGPIVDPGRSRGSFTSTSGADRGRACAGHGSRHRAVPGGQRELFVRIVPACVIGCCIRPA